MGKTLDSLLALAQSQVGYTEKDNDKDLDTKAGSTAGDGNHTKYARDLTAMGLSGYCGSAWCAVYQMWLEVKTVGKAQALKNMGPQFYNCFAIRDYAKSQKRWLDASGMPKAGYLVIFRQSHIARVTKVSGGRIYTNEGNTSNGTAVVRNGGMVCNKSYALTDGSILGYVQVEYMDEPIKAGWVHDKHGWWYRRSDGSYPANKWCVIKQHWYLFNRDGYMCTGWHRWDGGVCDPDDGSGDWYFFDNTKDGPLKGACWHSQDNGALEVWHVGLADMV